MRTMIWLLRLAVFLLLFALAIKNSADVELHFFLGGTAQWPLSMILLATFAAGVAVGISATAATLLRQRREIARLRKAARLATEG